MFHELSVVFLRDDTRNEWKSVRLLMRFSCADEFNGFQRWISRESSWNPYLSSAMSSSLLSRTEFKTRYGVRTYITSSRETVPKADKNIRTPSLSSCVQNERRATEGTQTEGHDSFIKEQSATRTDRTTTSQKSIISEVSRAMNDLIRNETSRADSSVIPRHGATDSRTSVRPGMDEQARRKASSEAQEDAQE